jgi:asparagine synthase (glutamine-hydrolysing)
VAFSLAISAASAPACQALVRAALDTDPRVLPVAGPASVTWHSADQRAAVIGWGPDPAALPPSIWAGPGCAVIHARTGMARVDPVYVAELPGAVVVSDRASWAAAVAGRLGSPDPVQAAALLNLGYPLGDATPFRGVRALAAGRLLRARAGRLTVTPADPAVADPPAGSPAGSPTGATRTASALIDAVAPLAAAGVPVEVSLTGGKDSRLIAAALTAAKVPFRARTHGAASHPDVVVAHAIAGRLGVEHLVTEPRQPGTASAADVVARLRSAVLVGDGMLSAFENTGGVDPVFAAAPVQVGGHGGELLRGGYAAYRGGTGAGNALRGVEQFRRLTTRRLRLLTAAAARPYLAALAPWTFRVARAPMHALDDFYLANRAGRWSAAARQAYRLRSELVQPFFDDRVVRAARTVPLRERVSGQLHRDLLAELCPELADIPFAGRGSAAAADWRRGDDVVTPLRDYVLDHGPVLSGVVSRRAAEQALRSPHADHEAAWLLGTLTALLSGDWLEARASR